jgi:hypothetical protein
MVRGNKKRTKHRGKKMKNTKMNLVEVVSVLDASALVGGQVGNDKTASGQDNFGGRPTDGHNTGDLNCGVDPKDGIGVGCGSGVRSMTDGSPDAYGRAFGRSSAARRRRARASLTIF